ncbi:MAG: hypothetical protein V4621_02640 [Pseudomonadota bacterium]
MPVLNKYEALPIASLMVNPDNDRHGVLDDEIEAMNWLLTDSSAKIKTLAKDIAEKGYVFAAPLVSKVDDVWLMHDGNRRVTCVKMLQNPTLANDPTWQRFFEKLANNHTENIPSKLVCRIEEDQDVIEDIKFRLHAGGESGVGTVPWNLRQQQNHAIRTGKQHTPSLGVQIESLMKEKGFLSQKEELPVRNIERLLSSKKYQEKVGIAYTKGGNMSFIFPEDRAMKILKKVCADFMEKKITIDGLIKNAQKDEYFKKIAHEGFALNGNEQLEDQKPVSRPQAHQETPVQKRQLIQRPRYCLIPQDSVFIFDDHDNLNRIKAIITELQTLPLKKYVNAASVLFRVLIEACTNYYNETQGVHSRSDKIHVTVQAALDHMVQNGKIYGKDAEVLKKFSQQEEILSAHTFHTYVHSYLTTPSEQHLCAMWDTFNQYIKTCINQKADAEAKDAA